MKAAGGAGDTLKGQLEPWTGFKEFSEREAGSQEQA